MAFDYEERLLNNIMKFKQAENEELPSGLLKPELLEILRGRNERKAGIMAENNMLIGENIKPLLIEASTGGDSAEKLFALALRLFTLNESLDIVLALEIHKALLANARAVNDKNKIVRQLYWNGIIYQQIDRRLFLNEALSFYSEAVSVYKSQYFTLDKEARMYFNRCLGNLYTVTGSFRLFTYGGMENLRRLVSRFFDKVDEAVEFWNDEKVRALDPDFPWAGFINNSHQNTCSWVDLMRTLSPDKRSFLPELSGRIYDAVSALTKKDGQQIVSVYWPASRTKYMWLLSRHFAGEIGLDEVIRGLKDMVYAAAEDDYTDNGMFCNIFVPGIIFVLLNNTDEEYRAKYERSRSHIMDRAMKYCTGIPGGVSKQRANLHLTGLFRHFLANMGSESYLDKVFEFTVAHLPTYVHSVQVKKLAGILTKYFLRRNPEAFIGLLDTKSVKDVLDRQDAVLKLAEQAGLLHDIGKVSYANTVAIASRDLQDVEFKIIQAHVNSQIGNVEVNEVNEAVNCVKDVMLGHHKWYDGTGGYPSSFDNRASKYAFIIDIVSAADSIDAATDDIGRSYTKPITPEQVIDEVCGQSGTRYSPLLAEALQDPGVIKEVRRLVTEGRGTTYYEAYLQHIGE